MKIGRYLRVASVIATFGALVSCGEPQLPPCEFPCLDLRDADGFAVNGVPEVEQNALGGEVLRRKFPTEPGKTYTFVFESSVRPVMLMFSSLPRFNYGERADGVVVGRFSSLTGGRYWRHEFQAKHEGYYVYAEVGESAEAIFWRMRVVSEEAPSTPFPGSMALIPNGPAVRLKILDPDLDPLAYLHFPEEAGVSYALNGQSSRSSLFDRLRIARYPAVDGIMYEYTDSRSTESRSNIGWQAKSQGMRYVSVNGTSNDPKEWVIRLLSDSDPLTERGDEAVYEVGMTYDVSLEHNEIFPFKFSPPSPGKYNVEFENETETKMQLILDDHPDPQPEFFTRSNSIKVTTCGALCNLDLNASSTSTWYVTLRLPEGGSASGTFRIIPD